jgi:iron complex transport system substrate-binding protein
MVCALGLADQLVGITHECDYPESVRHKPVVVRNALDLSTLSVGDIDRAVSERIGSGASLYQVDEALVRKLQPDLILTQNLCQVCAPSGNEVSRLLQSLSRPPDILWLTPKTISDIEQNSRDIGRAVGKLEEAEHLIAAGQKRLQKIAERTRRFKRPRVFCMEWLDPVYGAGHWIPEMVTLAGGEDALGRPGLDSVRIPWSHVLAWDPEILILAPCGFTLSASRAQAAPLIHYPGWKNLSAVQQGKVYAVDANAYFARPGPRVVDGVELLAHLIHPEFFDWNGAADAYSKIDYSR